MRNGNPVRVWSCLPCYAQILTRQLVVPPCSCGREMVLGKIPNKGRTKKKRERKKKLTEREQDQARIEQLRQVKGPVRLMCPPECTCLVCQLRMPTEIRGGTNFPTSGTEITISKPRW